jgi:hypothetical protein
MKFSAKSYCEIASSRDVALAERQQTLVSFQLYGQNLGAGSYETPKTSSLIKESAPVDTTTDERTFPFMTTSMLFFMFSLIMFGLIGPWGLSSNKRRRRRRGKKGRLLLDGDADDKRDGLMRDLDATPHNGVVELPAVIASISRSFSKNGSEAQASTGSAYRREIDPKPPTLDNEAPLLDFQLYNEDVPSDAAPSSSLGPKLAGIFATISNSFSSKDNTDERSTSSSQFAAQTALNQARKQPLLPDGDVESGRAPQANRELVGTYGLEQPVRFVASNFMSLPTNELEPVPATREMFVDETAAILTPTEEDKGAVQESVHPEDALPGEEIELPDAILPAAEESELPHVVLPLEEEIEVLDDTLLAAEESELPDDARTGEEESELPDDARTAEEESELPDDARTAEEESELADEALPAEEENDAIPAQEDNDFPDDALPAEEDNDIPTDTVQAEDASWEESSTAISPFHQYFAADPEGILLSKSSQNDADATTQTEEPFDSSETPLVQPDSSMEADSTAVPQETEEASAVSDRYSEARIEESLGGVDEESQRISNREDDTVADQQISIAEATLDNSAAVPGDDEETQELSKGEEIPVVDQITPISKAALGVEKIVNSGDEESLVPSKGDALPNVDPEERSSNGKQSPEVWDGVENAEETPALFADEIDDATQLDSEVSETHPAQATADFESEEDATCSPTDGDTFTVERIEDDENGTSNNDLSADEVEEEKLCMEGTDPISTPNKETESCYESGDDEACWSDGVESEKASDPDGVQPNLSSGTDDAKAPSVCSEAFVPDNDLFEKEGEEFSEAPSEFCVTASQAEMDEDEETKSESVFVEQDEETTQMAPSVFSRHQISLSSRAKPTKDEDSVDSSIFTSGSNVESGGIAAPYKPVDPPAIIPESATRDEIIDGSVESMDGLVKPATTPVLKEKTLMLTEVDRVYLQLEDDGSESNGGGDEETVSTYSSTEYIHVDPTTLSHVSQFIDDVRSRSRDHDGDGDVDASTVPDDDELLDKLGLAEVKHQFSRDG